jgi:hypothetical protein
MYIQFIVKGITWGVPQGGLGNPTSDTFHADIFALFYLSR